jgi:signal peptide peptidase SppA
MKHTIAVASNPLIARFTDDLTFINPDQGERVLSMLEATYKHPDYVKLTSAKPDGERADDNTDDEDRFWPDAGSYLSDFRPYNVKDGVLTIPVKGVLLSGFPYTFYGFATGYDYIAKAMERGVADGMVKGIALDIDSPGGECKNNFDLVDAMYAQAKEKPVRAFANESAYSAAYNIASVGDQLIVSRTGGVGSIGVVTSHVDLSKYLENVGIKITFIHAGKHKVDGNPYEPLSKDAKSRIQARIDMLYDIFVASVARNRSMDEKAIRATEALCYSADDAIQVGLADAVGAMKEARADFAAELNSNEGTTSMATFTQEQYDAAVSKAATDAAAKAKADNDKALADATAKATADATAAATKAHRDRMTAILGLDVSKNRPKAAMNVVTKTEMTVEQAKDFLADMPEEKPTATRSGSFDVEMDKPENQPNLGAGDKGGDDKTGDADADVKGILAAQAVVHGKKPEKKAA